jgi:hypothetical protein
LWRLNELGRLRVVGDACPISSNEAKVLIAAEFEMRKDPASPSHTGFALNARHQPSLEPVEIHVLLSNVAP